MALLGDINADVRRACWTMAKKKKILQLTPEDDARHERIMKMVPERIAYHEPKAREQEEAQRRSS